MNRGEFGVIDLQTDTHAAAFWLALRGLNQLNVKQSEWDGEGDAFKMQY